MRTQEADLGTQSQATEVLEPSSFYGQNESATANVRIFASVMSDLSIHREDIQAQFTSVKADLT
jgi:hypothetical protein